MKKVFLVASFFLLSLNSIAFTQTINLSENGTANCYIVSNKGAYSFFATIGNTRGVVPDLYKVDWLWMTHKKLITDVSLHENQIFFNAGEGKGNALIAAFDKQENIVWSWHIWLTDDPTENLHYVGSTEYKIMDRNLGATSTGLDELSSYGLYYQWGRKDPFIGGVNTGTYTIAAREEDAFSEGSVKIVFNKKYRKERFQLVNNNDASIVKGKSVEYSIAHPSTFIAFAENIDESKDSWFNENVNQYDNLWGAIPRTNRTQKSIYDPSPPGYKVVPSANDVWGMFDVGEFVGKLGAYVYYFDGKPCYYPAAGSRRPNNGRLQYTGYNGLYWTAIPYRTSGFCMSFEKQKVKVGIRVSRAMGLPVRCVKE